ncbi:MAG: hypothetical protein ACKOA8_12775, partial [Deltaproteobacteria bacterium]
MIETQSKNGSYIFFLTLLFTLFTVLLVGSFDSRLANSNGDDHPMVWARFIKNSEFWKGDGNFTTANSFARASLPNLLATLSIQWDQRLPKLLSWFYVLFQNVGLSVALFAFVRCFLQDAVWAAIVVILTMLMEPWGLNLAYYPSMMHSPYPGHLVMPLLVFASIALIKQSQLWMMALLVLASLIHPSQTLHFIALAMCYQLFQERKIQYNKYVPFILPALCTLVIPFLLIPKPTNPLTDLELLPSALNNSHLVPWSTNIFWPWGVPTMVMIFGLSWWASRSEWGRASRLYPFWQAHFLSFVLLASLHLVGVKLKILPLILLCPLRITVINSVLLVPIIFSFLIKMILESEKGKAFTAATLLTLMVFSKRGLFWGPLCILIFANSRQENRKGFIKAGVLTGIWWAAFLLLGRPLRGILGGNLSGTMRNVMAPGFSLVSWQIYLSIAIGVVASFYHEFGQRGFRFLKEMILISMIVGAAGQYYWTGRKTIEGELGAMLELQRWASQST